MVVQVREEEMLSNQFDNNQQLVEFDDHQQLVELQQITK